MRVIKGIAASLAILLFAGEEAQAQDWWWGLTYNMSATSSLPGNSDGDVNFIEDFSFRGIGVEARYLRERGANYSIGFNASWNVLNERNEFGSDPSLLL